MPVEWTADSWPRIAGELSSADVIRKPAGENVGNGMPISDEFAERELGLQWNYGREPDPADTFQSGGGQLRIKARGSTVTEAALLTVQPVNHAYEVQVEVGVPDTGEAGLIFVTRDGLTGAGVRKGQTLMYLRSRVHLKEEWKSNRAFLKLVDLNHDSAIYYSADGKGWKRFDMGAEFDGVSYVRVGLYATGTGTATYRQFRYHGLD
jgi:beta-xylosidase